MRAGRRIWDISQPLRSETPVWPGDTAFSAERTWALDADCPVNVSRISLSTHTGAHADAPFHYDPAGRTAEELDLDRYLGPCRLIDVTGVTGLVTVEAVVGHLDDCPPRVLLRTFAKSDLAAWPANFTTLGADLIELLADSGVVLIGVDAPSIDPETSKDLPAHNAVRRHDMAILEGLVLDDVPVGDYELIALPLPLVGLDASPVRAVLRSLT